MSLHRSEHDCQNRTLMMGCLVAAGLLLSAMAAVRADEPAHKIIKVEEDWEVHVAAPDPEANVPQIVCVFGPQDPATGRHAVFEINHSTAPNFTAGGMQLQAWDGENMLWYRNHPNNREFDAAVDYVKFTAVTELISDRLYLDIDYGDSANWGSFGHQGYLLGWLPTTRDHLNDYNAGYSVTHSRIAYGKHRVNRFVRKEVRYYTQDGLYQTDEEDVVVFQKEEE